jgi:hypothetical protein
MRSKNLPCRRDPPASAAALPAGEEMARLGPVLGQILHTLEEVRDRLAGAHKPLLTIEEL